MKTLNQPNAVCSFCEPNYDPKYMWCLSKQAIVFEPMKPIKCARYTGPILTQKQLEDARYLFNAGRRVS